SMDEVSIIGIDIAKNVFHLHGAKGEGAVIFRKSLPRSRVREYVARKRRRCCPTVVHHPRRRTNQCGCAGDTCTAKLDFFERSGLLGLGGTDAKATLHRLKVSA